MRPIKFKEHNFVYAEGQSEYIDLPVYRKGPLVIGCWEMSFRERLRFLFTNKLWVHVLIFGNKLQPMFLSPDYPFEEQKEVETITVNTDGKEVK